MNHREIFRPDGRDHLGPVDPSKCGKATFTALLYIFFYNHSRRFTLYTFSITNAIYNTKLSAMRFSRSIFDTACSLVSSRVVWLAVFAFPRFEASLHFLFSVTDYGIQIIVRTPVFISTQNSTF